MASVRFLVFYSDLPTSVHYLFCDLVLPSVRLTDLVQKGLVTDYESGLNWIRDGGLDEYKLPRRPRQEAIMKSDLPASTSFVAWGVSPLLLIM